VEQIPYTRETETPMFGHVCVFGDLNRLLCTLKRLQWTPVLWKVGLLSDFIASVRN